ncbi:MAG: nitroreductase family protein [Fibrobacteres bacterium]|nr:nitroreductase family protein [Fibrobacterota bacterium]
MNGEDFLDLCRARRSAREFLPVALDALQVATLLECAKSIPYASSRKGWDVVAIVDAFAISEAADAVDRAAQRGQAASAKTCVASGPPTAAISLPFAEPRRCSPPSSGLRRGYRHGGRAGRVGGSLRSRKPHQVHFQRDHGPVPGRDFPGAGGVLMTGPSWPGKISNPSCIFPRGRELAAFVAVGTRERRTFHRSP